MIVLGIVTLLNTHESLNVIAVMWGLLGLENAAAEIDESLKAHSAGHKWVAPLASGIFELVLGTMPLLAPIANLGHHVLLLGLELVVYPFHVASHEEQPLGRTRRVAPSGLHTWPPRHRYNSQLTVHMRPPSRALRICALAWAR